MTAESRCPVCEQPARSDRIIGDRTVADVVCRRCGRYEITDLVTRLNLLRAPESQALLPYLSAALRQATERGELLTVKSENWQSLAEGHAHTSVHRKLELVLEYCTKRSKHPGAHFTVDTEDFPLFDAATPGEVNYYVDALARQGLIQQPGAQGSYVVTPDGWARAMPMDPGGIPGTCFVAMAFDPSLDAIFEEGFRTAIEACGLRVMRVDKLQHNGVVTDVILAEIRRAQLVIADVTLQRQGVYFEAGFALGLGRIVIWTCREDELSRVHFDTRQYSHVVWVDAPDLHAKLEARIRGTVPIPVTR